MTLVATNVAARGLDINDVQLIIQVLLVHLHIFLSYIYMQSDLGMLIGIQISVSLHVM